MLTVKFARPVAQKMRLIKNLDKVLIEVIKYGSKILTRPEKGNLKCSPYVYTSALYNILDAMKGHRLFDRFGFNLPTGDNERVNSITKAENSEKWEFRSEFANWYNTKTNRPLSGYVLPPELYRILNYNLNSEIQ